jgi:hypothetical protein
MADRLQPLQLLLLQLQVAVLVVQGLTVQPSQQERSKDAKYRLRTQLLGRCYVLTARSKSQPTEAIVFPYIILFFHNYLIIEKIEKIITYLFIFKILHIKYYNLK